MRLKPNINNYQKNEYYLLLSFALLPSIATEFSDVLPMVVIRMINVVVIGIGITLAWMKEPVKNERTIK